MPKKRQLNPNIKRIKGVHLVPCFFFFFFLVVECPSQQHPGYNNNNNNADTCIFLSLPTAPSMKQLSSQLQDRYDSNVQTVATVKYPKCIVRAPEYQLLHKPELRRCLADVPKVIHFLV